MTKWYIAIENKGTYSYQYLPSNKSYIFEGSEKMAQNIYHKLCILKTNKTFREYLTELFEYGYFDETDIKNNILSDTAIKKYIKNNSKFEDVAEECNKGYIKFDNILEQLKLEEQLFSCYYLPINKDEFNQLDCKSLAVFFKSRAS